MHPLTFATFGVYGDPELPQNGMPFRITIPWKYGFKSAKFITRISFTAHRPPATWHQETPQSTAGTATSIQIFHTLAGARPANDGS
ncbi:MAG: hypothetical protein CM1200mP41_03570 [Gammaproteobacteria bacterium]|nr:MAG: hypothetical protein CM1200mP41_03570 [Gammaproteobacteria bacterium]